MRFRADVEKQEVTVLMSIVAGLKRVNQSQIMLKVSPTQCEFTVRPDDDSDSAMQVFATIPSSYFSSWLCSAQHGDLIGMLLSPVHLIAAFRSATHSEQAHIRLTKRKGLVVLLIVSETVKGIKVTKDVPIVRILGQNEASRDELMSYAQPRGVNPDLALDFPDPKHVSTMLERMGRLDKFVNLEANSRGVMTFKVQNEMVSMRSWYRGLDVKARVGGVGASRGQLVRCVVRLKIKELQKVVSGCSLENDGIVLCANPNQALIVYVKLGKGAGTFVYFIPLVNEGENEMDEDGTGDVNCGAVGDEARCSESSESADTRMLTG